MYKFTIQHNLDRAVLGRSMDLLESHDGHLKEHPKDCTTVILKHFSHLWTANSQDQCGISRQFSFITRLQIVSQLFLLNKPQRTTVFFLFSNKYSVSFYRFRITYRLILREKELHFHIGVFNPSKDVTFSFNLLLHTYLKVPDVRRCQISGLHGCTFIDKVHQIFNQMQIFCNRYADIEFSTLFRHVTGQFIKKAEMLSP